MNTAVTASGGWTIAGHRAWAYAGGRPWQPATGGPGLVLIHGALHDHSVWTLVARWFAHHGLPVLAVDLPGHGRSGGAPLADVESLADWVLSLADAAGLGSLHLAGHSMGSLIALEAAARAGARAASLSLLATAFPMAVSPALLELAQRDPLAAMDRVNAFSHAGLAPKPGYPGPGTWLRGANRALMRRMQAGWPEGNLFAHDFGVCDRYAGGPAAAAALRCPVQFLLGTKDQMTSPKAVRPLLDALPAELPQRRHLLDTGHALMQEDPDGVLQALRQWILGP